MEEGFEESIGRKEFGRKEEDGAGDQSAVGP